MLSNYYYTLPGCALKTQSKPEALAIQCRRAVKKISTLLHI